MTLEQACEAILGKALTRDIITHQGIHLCVLSAIASAKRSHKLALARLLDYLNQVYATKH